MPAHITMVKLLLFNLARFMKKDDFLNTSSSSSFSAFPSPCPPAHAGRGLAGLQTARESGILSMKGLEAVGFCASFKGSRGK